MPKHKKPRSAEHCKKLSEATTKYGGFKHAYTNISRSEARRRDWVRIRKRDTVILLSPSGTTHTVTNMKRWCQLHNLHRSAMCQMVRDAKGDTPKYGRKHHKNWRVVRVVKPRKQHERCK